MTPSLFVSAVLFNLYTYIVTLKLLMSSHRAAVHRSDSWDMDFYLLVVSGVSTRTRTLRYTASPRARKPSEIRGYAGRTRLADVEPATANQGILAFENHPTLRYLTRTQT